MIFLTAWLLGVGPALWLIRQRRLGLKHKLAMAALWPILVMLVVAVVATNFSLDDRHHDLSSPHLPEEEETETVL